MTSYENNPAYQPSYQPPYQPSYQPSYQPPPAYSQYPPEYAEEDSPVPLALLGSGTMILFICVMSQLILGYMEMNEPDMTNIFGSGKKYFNEANMKKSEYIDSKYDSTDPDSKSRCNILQKKGWSDICMEISSFVFCSLLILSLGFLATQDTAKYDVPIMIFAICILSMNQTPMVVLRGMSYVFKLIGAVGEIGGEATDIASNEFE